MAAANEMSDPDESGADMNGLAAEAGAHVSGQLDPVSAVHCIASTQAVRVSGAVDKLALRPDERPNWRTSTPFLLFHLVPLLAVFTGVTVEAVVVCVALYLVRIFFVTAGYHRYFAHRSYRTSRGVQFLLAFGGTTAVQKGPLWWASHHRAHHRYADTEQDVHTPLKGFWHSHVGWILADRHGTTDLDAVRDLARFPELRFLDRHDWIGPWALGIGTYLLAGWSGLVVGFFLSTVLLWHATFLVNSLAHVMGRRRYATADTSRNSAVIALLTFGEGWHNNHHHFPSAARQGFYWWELDLSWYVLRALAALRVVQGLRVPPAHVLERSRIAAGACDIGILRAHLMRALTAVARTSPPQDSLGRSPAVESTTPAGLLTKRQLVQDLVGGSMQAVEAYATAARRERAARRSEASA